MATNYNNEGKGLASGKGCTFGISPAHLCLKGCAVIFLLFTTATAGY